MELTQFAKFVRRGWAIVLTATLLGLLAGVALTASAKSSFVATTTLFVSAQNTGATTDLQQGNAFTLSRVKSYADVATSGIVLNSVIQSLGLDLKPAELAKMITASFVPDTVLVTIEVASGDARQATNIANAIGTSLIEAAKTVEAPIKSDASPVKITIVTYATVPTAPANSGGVLKIALGILVGLAVGLIIALIRGSLDTRVRSEIDLTSDSPPVLATVGSDHRLSGRTKVDAAVPDPSAEAHGQFLTNLQVRAGGSAQSSILFASSLPSEGTTTTAISLARVAANNGHSVVLVDANLRRPAIGRLLGLEQNVGLTSLLSEQMSVDDAVQHWGPDDLAVITAGPPTTDASQLLGSVAATELFRSLEDSYDVVIVDGPPLLAVPDSIMLSRAVGAVVLVVGSGCVTRKSVSRALSAIDLVDAQVWGIALTRVPARLMEAAARSTYR